MRELSLYVARIGAGHVYTLVSPPYTYHAYHTPQQAVHPQDPRYTHLHGKKLVHPFNGRLIPIVCDDVLVRA